MLKGATALWLISAAAPALAQSAPESDSQDDSEIVVTAQKREERLQDVPISISALSEKELESSGTRNLQDISRTVPGLVLLPSSRGVNGAPVIRGIAGTAGAPTVGIYVDDVPITARASNFAGNVDPRLFDVQRVEVLRGPQGTLYGASSMGGTIRYLTTAPSFTDYSGRVRTELSSTAGGGTNYELAGAAGGPIVTDTLAVRVSGLVRRDAGFVERIDRTSGALVASNVDNSETVTLRGAVVWRPAAGLEIEPAVLYQKVKRDDLPVYVAALPGTSQNNTSPQPGVSRTVIPSLTLRYDFGWATFTSVTSTLRKREWQDLDYSTLQSNIFSGMDFFPGFEDYRSTSHSQVTQEDFAQEIRFASSGDGPFTWLIGGFYRKTEDSFSQFVADFGAEPLLTTLTGGLTFEQAVGLPLLPGSGVYQGQTDGTEKELAGFGEVTYMLLPGLRASAGVRVSRVELDFERLTQGPLNGGVQHVAGSRSDSPVTPKFGLSYEASQDLMVYAIAQRGFRAGGVNPPVPLGPCAADLAASGGTPASGYGPDSLWSYEAGIKFQAFGRKLSANAAVYQIDWTDIQQPVNLPGCGFGYTDNLGKARSRGFELETTVRPVTGLSLSGRVGHTDAILTEDLLAPPNPTTGVRNVISRNGDRVVGVPKWTVSLTGEYRAQVAEGAEIFLRGDYQWIDGVTRTQPPGRIGYNAITYQGDSYDRASARLGLELDGGWEIAGFVENLFNDRPVISASTALSPAQRTLRVTTLQPRTFGIALSRDF
ncbi:TonB-dependent receptor [Sphingomonas canadensis]|nr:TonB-dependent receptor [Sphingomonas canadensis]